MICTSTNPHVSAGTPVGHFLPLSKHAELIRSQLDENNMFIIAGSEDAFETGTGVHASAVIKAMKKGDHWLADRVYSGVPANDFGLQQKIRIGHMSGRSNILWWLEQNQIDSSDELVSHIFEVAKSQRRLMSDEEILQVISEFQA